VRLNEIHDRYQADVEFLCVYIQEAHPEDGWHIPMNELHDVVYKQHRTEQERADVAEACVLGLDLRMPMALDAMTNEVDRAYAALPERLYVIDADGRIVLRSDPGPWGFDLDAWEQAIQAVRSG